MANEIALMQFEFLDDAGRLVSSGDRTQVRFGENLLIREVTRGESTPTFKYYQRWGGKPKKKYLYSGLAQFRMSGDFTSESWADGMPLFAGQPFRYLRKAYEQGRPVSFKLDYNIIKSESAYYYTTMPPFDEVAGVLGGTNIQVPQLFNIMDLREVGTEQRNGILQYFDWSMTLEEIAE